MAADHLSHLTTWLLARAHARSRRLLEAAFVGEAARPVHWRALMALMRVGAMSQADLGRLLDVDRKDTSVVVVELEELGAVARRPDPDDARRKLVELTDEGRDLLEQWTVVVDGAQRAVEERLTKDEVATLHRLLAKLT